MYPMPLVRTALRITAGLASVSAFGLGFVYWYDSTGQRPDKAFDTSVKVPTYLEGGPLVVFDVGHRNWHTPTGRYRPLADLFRHDGYRIGEIHSEITAASLDSVRVLIVANAIGPSGHEGWDAFTAAECEFIAQWVRKGGALLLVADHAPFGAAAASLARTFGVTMYRRFARDDAHHAGWDNEKLLFSRTNALLMPHPITDGRVAGERVDSVVAFTGQSLSVPSTATALLRMDNDAYDWESRKVRYPAGGHAVGIAMPFGAGRVVVLGEAGMLSAQVDPLGIKMGMNRAGNDNRQFALNILRWLSESK
jgi:hypothetical protein